MPYDSDSLFSDDIEPAPKPRTIPQSPVAEAALLGTLLSNNKAYDRVAGFLRAEHFSDPVNVRIYQAIARRIDLGQIADPITLKAELEHDGKLAEVGGSAYLAKLTTAMVGIINAGDYGRVILDTWMRRGLIHIGDVVTNKAFGEGGDDAVKIAMDTISLIDSVAGGSGPLLEHSTTLDAAVDIAIEAMTRAKENKTVPGISTGFTCFDERLGGLEPGLVYVIAGRPGMGKSALGHRICLNAATNGVHVLELSLEMSAMQLARRALAIEAGVPLSAIKSGQLSDDDCSKVVKASGTIRGLPLTIDDAGGQTPRMIMAKARELKRRKGLGLVMVDHLNLTRPDGDDAKHGPTHIIERASGSMLQLAKDLNVPVLMLTQLNRGVEGREDKRPGLSDLRQSGAIEQDAYAIGFVYRAEYYKIYPERKDGETRASYDNREADYVDEMNRIAGSAEVIWGKVRDGAPGPDHIRFDARTTRFYEKWGP